ncbi:MAG: hypothetical protein O3B74_00475, partial [Proteobacteria bacterium]|nr:hypothetical protein [Pseudomonadota bacterium]
FRNFWALGGKILFDGADRHFHNPRLIEAAKQSFKAEVIRPVAMMTNLNLPGDVMPIHLDLPFFRGLMNREVPAWMLAPMGYSGLFHDWAVPVASMISWFYDGEGGGFEYWPDGLDAPSRIERPPYFNRGVLADNEYMHHRVCATGRPEDYVALEDIPYDALLERRGDDGWDVVHDGEVLRRYGLGAVRCSVLWKAYCFADEAAAAAYDNHADDLTPDHVTEIFRTDLRGRGVTVAEPGDIGTDLAWQETLAQAYPAPSANAG